MNQGQLAVLQGQLPHLGLHWALHWQAPQ